MPSTAIGTEYTVYSATLPTHGQCNWAVADSRAADSDIPTVLYAHGSQGAADQFATLSAWANMRNWLIDNGWAWIEGLGGADLGLTNWGNDAARAAYPAYLEHVDGILNLGPKVLLGRSMGGLVTAWLYAKSGIADEFSGWINNSGVSTLFVGNTFNPSNESTTSGYYFRGSGSSGTYAGYGVTSYAALQSAAADHAPESWEASVWAGKNILCCYGDADLTVPWSSRGAAPLREIWNGLPERDLVSIRPGGDHTGTNGSYLDVSAMTDFLITVTGGDVSPPVPPTYRRIVNSRLVFGGQQFPYSPRPKLVPPV